MDENCKIKTFLDAKHILLSHQFENKSHQARFAVRDIEALRPRRLAGPIIIEFKILLQKLWIRGIDWDEMLPDYIQQQ